MHGILKGFFRQMDRKLLMFFIGFWKRVANCLAPSPPPPPPACPEVRSFPGEGRDFRDIEPKDNDQLGSPGTWYRFETPVRWKGRSLIRYVCAIIKACLLVPLVGDGSLGFIELLKQKEQIHPMIESASVCSEARLVFSLLWCSQPQYVLRHSWSSVYNGVISLLWCSQFIMV